jgi:hypothetical protein
MGALTSNLEALTTEMVALKRHCVYGFFTACKKLICTGQSKDFGERLRIHFDGVFATKSVNFVGL